MRVRVRVRTAAKTEEPSGAPASLDLRCNTISFSFQGGRRAEDPRLPDYQLDEEVLRRVDVCSGTAAAGRRSVVDVIDVVEVIMR